ncbi:MAG: hypothetical protein ACE5JH_12150 [Acidobacteriota bacterium]
MATSGQLGNRIERLKRKIAEAGTALPPERLRRQRKMLKRLQRARRAVLAREAKAKDLEKGRAETGADAGAAPPSGT